MRQQRKLRIGLKKFCFLTEIFHFSYIDDEIASLLPLNRNFLHQNLVFMLYNHHIRNQHEKMNRTWCESMIFEHFYFFSNFQRKTPLEFCQKMKFKLND